MRTSIYTAATTDPITTGDAKEHMRVTISDDDAYIDALINAATSRVESETNRALMTQTIDGYLDAFPADNYIELPLPPLQSVTSITYVDTDGATQTFSSASYSVDTTGIVGRVLLGYGESWPSTRDQYKAVTIRFVAGYSSASAVPQPIKAAIKLMVAHWYETREPVNIGNIVNPIPMTIEYLLAPYRVFSL